MTNAVQWGVFTVAYSYQRLFILCLLLLNELLQLRITSHELTNVVWCHCLIIVRCVILTVIMVSSSILMVHYYMFGGVWVTLL